MYPAALWSEVTLVNQNLWFLILNYELFGQNIILSNNIILLDMIFFADEITSVRITSKIITNSNKTISSVQINLPFLGWRFGDWNLRRSGSFISHVFLAEN